MTTQQIHWEQLSQMLILIESRNLVTQSEMFRGGEQNYSDMEKVNYYSATGSDHTVTTYWLSGCRAEINF